MMIMPLILSPDRSDHLSTSLLLTLIECMQEWLWPNLALLASHLGKPDGLLSDQHLLGMDERCQSESVIVVSARESF